MNIDGIGPYLKTASSPWIAGDEPSEMGDLQLNLLDQLCTLANPIISNPCYYKLTQFST